MFTRRSLLLSAAFILLFSGTTLANIPRTCFIQRNFTVVTSNHERAHLYQSELTVRIEDNSLSIISYPGINKVDVRINDVEVVFKGYMIVENVELGILSQPEIISKTYVDRISGLAERVNRNSTNSVVPDCRLVLLPTETDRGSINARVANEIRRLAESCVEADLCQVIGGIRDEYVVAAPSQSGSGLLSLYTDPLMASTPSESTNDLESSGLNLSHGTVQSAINKLVDVALAEIIEKLREKNEGIVNVPNIDKQFSTGSGIFETTGRFEAVDGKLRDLTTIRRTTDATLSHDGLKFVASCGFGLQILDLNYDRYKLKYGIIKVNGKMSADIDGMKLEASVAADYTQTPCVMELERLEVTEMGQMNIHITGLSPLNSMVSKLLGWVSQKWEEDIVRMIEKKLRKKVQDRLATFNCERFRP